MLTREEKFLCMNESFNTNAKLQGTDYLFFFKQLWTYYVLNKYWFVISIITCVLIAFLYLWFTPSTITITGKMQFYDKSNHNSGASAGMAILNSLPMGLGSSIGGASAGSIESEKEILQSYTMVHKVVKDLGLQTEYRLCSLGRNMLLYKNNPIIVTLDESHLQWFDTELPLTYHQIDLRIDKDSKGYTVETTLIENKEKTVLSSQTFATLPATIKTDVGSLTITENKLSEKQALAYKGDYTLKVLIVPPTSAAKSFLSRMSVNAPSKKVADMLNISLSDENMIRGIDFVNHVVDKYNQRANDEKNEEARKTDEFVNSRLAKLDVELGSSDAAWENSKKNFQITTPEVDAAEALEKKSAYEMQLVAIGTELQLHDYLSEYVNNPANLYEIIPAGISSAPSSDGVGSTSSVTGGGSAGTSSLLSQHNSLVNQRNELLMSMSEMSPQIMRVNRSIQELHPTIVTALKRDREQIVMRQNAIQREYGKYLGRVGSAPKMERVLTEIGRHREIKQGVYLLMLQKREQTAMDLANTTDKGKLIDPPTADPSSGMPQKKVVLIMAFLFGILLPMVILYLLLLLKSIIDSCEELEAVSKYPVLGVINEVNREDTLRAIRTNLLINLHDDQKVILISSDDCGDDKTFIGRHLADSLNTIGKKTTYINGNFRIKTDALPNSQLKSSHPSDVLASAEFANSIAQARSSSDYVIIDSPELGPYPDAYQLAQFADATLFVVKAGSTDKSIIEKLNHETKLPNIMLALYVEETTIKKYKLNKKN